ncbi:MAG: autotransporter outer membrane beta-barrel domain-containing protein [Pseudomonadota bacterium]
MRRHAAVLLAVTVLAGAAPGTTSAQEEGADKPTPSVLEVPFASDRTTNVALVIGYLQEDIARRARIRMLEPATGLGRGPRAGSGSGNSPESFAVWTGLHGATLSFNADGFDGDHAGGTVGVDFDLGPDWLAGFRFGYDDTDLDTAFDGRAGTLEARSFSFTFYGAWRPYENWVVDGFFGVARTTYDIASEEVTGSADGDRFLGGLGASALYDLGGFRLTPRVSLAMAVDSAVDFQDSVGLEVTNDLLTYIELLGGGEAAYPLALSDGTVLEPWLSAALVGTLDEVGRNSAVGDGVHGRFGAGLRLRHGQIALDIEGCVGGLGDRDFTDYGGLVRFAWQF